MGDAVYRVWFELQPLTPAYWWLVEHGLTWPFSRTAWLRKAEMAVRLLTEQNGWALIGDPIADVEKRDGKVVVRAQAMAHGPMDAAAPSERGPEGIDG